VATTTAPQSYSITNISDFYCSQPFTSAVKTLTINPLPDATVLGGTEVCEDAELPKITFKGSAGKVPYTFTYAINGEVQPIVKAKDSVATTLVRTNKAGSFKYTITNVKDANGCQSKPNKFQVVTVNQNPYASFIASPEVSSVLEPLVNIYNTSALINSKSTFQWNFGDSTKAVGPKKEVIEHNYDKAGTYTIKLTAINNYPSQNPPMCISTATQEIKKEQPLILYMPNSFSPNKDGINEVFKAEGDKASFKQFRMSIYDRWGSLVFYSEDIDKGWDGTVKGSDKTQMDAYVYIINIKDLKNHDITYRGIINLTK
jgi:gliding motility-associated-like protein